MREIPLSNGGHAIVDDADFEILSRHSWRRDPKGYVHRTTTGPDRRCRHVYMHKVLAATSADRPQVDHINGDPLDNRRSNLRACSRFDNARNHAKRRDTANSFKGVDRDTSCGKLRFRARIQADGKIIRSSWFDDELTAAREYDSLAIRHHGEFARLNFGAGATP